MIGCSVVRWVAGLGKNIVNLANQKELELGLGNSDSKCCKVLLRFRFQMRQTPTCIISVGVIKKRFKV